MAVKTRYRPPKPVLINTPKIADQMGAGFYHGMVLQAIGVDTDDLIVVPLPDIPGRSGYQGRFKPEFIEFIED